MRVATAQARHAEGVDILRGCVLTLVRGGDDRPAPTTFERRDDWYAVLEGQLGLRLDVGEDARERLWAKVAADHERRIAAADAG